MKKMTGIISLLAVLVLTGCTKTDLPPQQWDPNTWMQTHERAEVAYTDYFTGNYIVATRQGYAVVEAWGGAVPRDMDVLYAHFQFTGMQTIYNRSRNYFTQGRIVATWLTWSEAWYLLQQMP